MNPRNCFDRKQLFCGADAGHVRFANFRVQVQTAALITGLKHARATSGKVGKHTGQALAVSCRITRRFLMGNTLRLYRAIVVSTIDPEGLGRVKLGTTRTVRGSPVIFEGWAAVGATPLGASVAAVAAYSAGEAVLYAAERLPFDGAVLLCRVGGLAANTGSIELSVRVSLGQGNEATIEAADGALRIRTTAGQQVTLQANGAIDVLGSADISLGATKIAASAGLVTIDAGMTRFSGVVKCDTLITNTVIAATYTPGAGNIA
ncbi:MAG: hypothetical protein ACRC2B_04240 [Rubrivivax sp.]